MSASHNRPEWQVICAAGNVGIEVGNGGGSGSGSANNTSIGKGIEHVAEVVGELQLFVVNNDVLKTCYRYTYNVFQLGDRAVTNTVRLRLAP